MRKAPCQLVTVALGAVLLAACAQPTPSPTPTPTAIPSPTALPAPNAATAPTPTTVAARPTLTPTRTPTPSPVPTATPSPTPVPTPFWNQARVGEDGEPLPSCGDSIFTHPVVDPEDANPFFLGNKVYPHDHMVYWGTRKLYERDSPPAAGVPGVEQVQLYAPADIYFIEFWRIVLESHDGGTYEDWGITATICEGYSLGWGHVGRPVEEILGAFSKTVPIDQSDCPASTIEEALVTTEVGVCRWRVFFNPPIKAGTPVWKSSGYSAGFDFGLSPNPPKG